MKTLFRPIRSLSVLALAVLPVLAAAEVKAEMAAEAEEAMSAQQLARARLLYFQCRACHSLTREEGHKVGPSLAGIFGLAAGTIEDFSGYSLALRESGLVWDRETMDEWIRSPASLVPGNTMAYLGLHDQADRELLVRYLEYATREEESDH